MADPNSHTSDIHYFDNNSSTGEWDNNNNQSSTSALYPLIPPLPLPLSSKYSHTFQPSAPPSAPPPTSSPWASAPVYPSTDSHSYSPTTYTPSYPVDYTTNHQAEDYTAYDSATNPWHAPSHSPTKEDLQPEQPLYPEPSAPPIYPVLPIESNYHNFHHQHQHKGRQYPHSAWDGQNADHDQTPSYPRLDSTFLIQHPSSKVSAQRLRELYSNRFLQDLPQRLSDYERSSVTHSVDDSNKDAFFHYLKSYEVAYEAVQQSHLAIFNLQQKAKGYASKLWAVQTKSEIAKAICGDGATIAHNYSYQVGQHEPKVAEKLKKSLSRLHKQRTKSLLRMQFEESSSRLWIQDHIAEFLNSVHWKSDSEAGLQRARNYLDILFHFERSVRRQPDFDTAAEERQASAAGSDASVSSSDEAVRGADQLVSSVATNSILRSIHGWADLLAGAVLAFGGFKEREHLIVQVLRSRQVADWATNYVQCNPPTIWSQDFEEFYLTQLQLVLCGSASLDHEATKEPVSDMSLDIGSTLDEDDCSALLDQMDVAVFFNRMLDEHSGMHSNDGTLYQKDLSEREALQALTTTRRIFDILLRGLEKRIGFTVVAKRLSQTLCQLAQILGDHLLVLGPIKSKAISDETFSITIDRYNHTTTTLQLEVDHILTDVTKALLALPNLGLWTFLPSVPFKFMSDATVAQVLEEVALDNIQEWIAHPSGLLSIASESNKLRYSLGCNPGEAVFLLTAIAALATSRSQVGLAQVQDGLGPTVHDSIASIVAFLLLDVGFLDRDIRGELAKPVREILRSICDSHAAVISFILRFVAVHFEEMGDMAQYLFRELSFDEWRMSSSDFATLQKFLETPPLSSQQSLFARYVLGSLPWTRGDTDDNNGQYRMAVPEHFRKELALTLTDICIQQITNITAEAENAAAKEDTKVPKDDRPNSPARIKSTEHTFVGSLASTLPHAITHLAAHSGLHHTAEQTATKAFMDWCWIILVKLELTDVRTLSLLEASRLHVQDPGLAKFALFSQGQLTFVKAVHLLLTEASRDVDQFLQEGWITLTAVLHAGVGSVFLDLVGRLVPPIIFSGLDLKPHAAKFGQLLRDVGGWKQDPMLARSAALQQSNKGWTAPHNVAKELMGLWSLLRAHLEQGRVRGDGGTISVIQFWMAAIFSQKEWMLHQECVQVLDVVCHVAFEHGLHTLVKDALLEQQILLSIGYRRAPGVSAELMGLAQPGLDKVMDMLPERFVKALPLSVPQGSSDPSLLMGTWSVKAFATNLFTQQAMVESTSVWFAYYALSVETGLERDMRIKVGNYYRQHPAEVKVHGNIKTVVKTLGITSRKTLQNFAIWRWTQHLLALPVDTFLLPLFWQMFFSLYFGHAEHPTTFYGYKFLETNPEIVEQLKERLQTTYTHFGQEARKAVQVQDLKRAGPLTTLHEMYIALYGWISEPLLLTPEIDLRRIRKDLMPELLTTCRLPDPLESNSDLWKSFLLTEQDEVKSAFSETRPGRSSSSFQEISSPPRSRNTDTGRSRAVRKHSHAWQEQKIVNCIAKQSKAGPEFFVPRVLAPAGVIGAQSTPQGLFSQTIRSVRDYYRNYETTNEAYTSLDVVYLSELGALYHNEVRAKRIDIACDTTPNTHCVRAAVIELKYEEIIVNDRVKNSIVENRQRARELRLGSVEQGLCLAALEISKTISTLLDRLELDPSNTNLRELSVRSFYYLCNELLRDASTYPPAFVLLTSIVETLGMEVVAKDPSQTEPILDLMKTDDFTISLLFKTFYPAAIPSDFVRLYNRIAACKEYGLVSKDRLLRQFDVQAWAVEPITNAPGGDSDQQSKINGPSVLDRLAFYEVAFTAMVAQQQLQKQDDRIQEATELSTRDRLAIIKSHRELAGTLFLNFLQQDYVEYLRILFDTCGIMCLEPEVLEDFIRILGVEPTLIPALLDGADATDERLGTGGKALTRVGLSDYDLGRLVQFLADYFVECQEKLARGNLLDRYSGYAVSIASLLTAVLCDERYFTKWIKSFPESIGYSTSVYGQSPPTDTGDSGGYRQAGTLVSPTQCRMWHDTLMVFQPWLSCLTDRAVDEIRFQRQQGGASRLLFTFVGIVSKMMTGLQAHFGDGSLMLQELFDFWLELLDQSTLGQGSINQIMLLHQHFHRLDWTGLELSKERVERILEVKTKLSVEIRVDFWTYLVTVLMESADSDLRPRHLKRLDAKGTAEWHQTEAAFLKLGTTILQDADLICGGDLDVRQQLLDRIWSTVLDAGDWALLSMEELRSQVEGFKVQWDRAGMWDDLTSPLGLLLYWMRIAVGLESTDLTELDQNDSMDYGMGGRRLSVERVLIYFGYTTRLLQVRLASSAEDSQNVNFRADAIPHVVVHLGQVLDRIAGSRHQVRHPDIHRSLLTLVSFLNQCEPEPAAQQASSLSSLSSPVYDMVLQGLKRMISDVEVIQLDVVRVICQRINSIPVMVNLLEEAIEREFDLWAGEQGSRFDRIQSASAMSMSGSVFGLEDTPLQQTISPMPWIGHIRSNTSHTPEHHRTNSGDGRNSWSKVKAQIEAPELTEDEFLDQAFKQGAILTIYGRFLQLLEECEQSQEFDEVLELGQELAEVISKVNLQVIEPWKAYQSLLLLRMFLTLVAKESIHSVLQSRFLSSVMQVCRTLELWFQDRDSTKGMLSSIGMGTRSTLDAKFRMVVRIIYTYLVVRLADKGLSIHHGTDTGHAGGGGGVLAWRKERLSSVQSLSDGSSAAPGGDGSGGKHESRDVSTMLTEALAQLPAKNKDYAIVFVSPPTVGISVHKGGSATGGAAMTMALLPALASSPLDIVKRTIMSTPPPPLALGPSPTTSNISTPTWGMDRRRHNHSSASSVVGGHNKRLSIQSHHSRFSTGSSWDDTAGTILFPEDMMDLSNGLSSPLSATAATTAAGELAATRRRAGGSSSQQQPTEYRVRLQQGTKNGMEDLVWAVAQIKDRRFRILEAADFMEEVLERFYDGDDYFA
ncbi:Ectopic P granules protein 5 [Mortierella hygrophila]|uniref:Ectopic P granules protein 5 n=1 Tax=Mortierella hygrophila TaxID=979708 RepID=A0A9P6K0X8_9FUNG|nr:Ectopic P granules protein 5 [Mortierella hygrophila]